MNFEYYYDPITDTIRRYPEGKEEGQRWDKKSGMWSNECCVKTGCRWDEQVSEKNAELILDRQRELREK
jgi:hypothetical protein